MTFKLDNEGNQILDKDGNPIPVEQSGDDSASLKNQIEDLKLKVQSLEKDIELQKDDNKRLEAFKEKILSEKREEVEKRKSLEQLLEGHTPEEVKSAIKLSKEGKDDRELEIKTIVDSRIKDYKEDFVEPLQKETQELRKQKENLKQKLAGAIVVREIMSNAKIYGAREDALEFFEVAFKNRIGVNESGDKVYYNQDGHETDNINWEMEMIKLRDKSPFLFDKNKGSRASGNGSPREEDVVNPWAKETKNYSRQIEIETTNPELAKRLKEKAA
jgi:hypothetical protein